jgi:ribosomal protein L29
MGKSFAGVVERETGRFLRFERIERGQKEATMEVVSLDDEGLHNDVGDRAIADLRAELKGDIADLRAETASLRTELKGDITDVRLEIAELRTEMHQMFRKNYMVMISAIFTINSLFFAATKFWG